MTTPHNGAEKGYIAKKILLPGDPLRAKFIAENFLENPKQFNAVRNMFGYTGTYKGEEVSVMGTGMGVPSIGIYTYELIHNYGAEKLIRVGSCGAYQDDLELFDLIIAQAACTDSNYANQYNLGGVYSAISSYDLLSKAVDECKKKNFRYSVGNVMTSDIFYHDNPESWKAWKKMGVLAVEMESYALFCNAARAGVKALTILTVSDSLVSHKETTAEEREKSFTNMMEVALEI